MSDSPRIVWQRRDGSSEVFPLVGGLYLVGRDERADIFIDEPLVSRAHARLERRSGEWFVIDLGSTNSTHVNGTTVAQQPLKSGDEVRFGRARCRYLLGPEPEAETADAH